LASTVKNTTLGFGMVSLEVALKKAGAKKDVKFDRATDEGHAIGRVEIDAVTKRQLEDSDLIQKGYRAPSGEFFPISGDAIEVIDNARADALPGLDIEEFVAVKDLPYERTINSYFIVPQKDSGSAKGLKYLLKGLTKTKKAGIVRFILKSREYLAAVYAKDNRLMMAVLGFADDYSDALDEAKNLLDQGGELDSNGVKMTINLIDSLTGDGAVLNSAKDELVEERIALLEEARAGKPVKGKASKAAKPKPKRDSFAEQVEASLAQAKDKVPA
jgi:DNA end-binding protein Ku